MIGSTEREPLLGGVIMTRLAGFICPSKSVSLASISITKLPSSATVAVSELATGILFTAVTVVLVTNSD